MVLGFTVRCKAREFIVTCAAAAADQKRVIQSK